MGLRHPVPEFRLPPMVVVDGIEHQVFIVPTEGRVLHAYIEPWDINARDISDPWELKQRIRLGAQVGEVPRVVHIIIGPVVNNRLSYATKARAKLLDIEVCGILHASTRPYLIFDELPIVLLNLPKVVVIPLLKLATYFHQLREGMPFAILVKRLPCKNKIRLPCLKPAPASLDT